MHSLSLQTKGLPLHRAKGALILVHGRGGTAKDIITLADEFPIKDFYVVAPQATGNTWYPYSFLSPLEHNEPWLTSAVETLLTLLNQIAEVVPYNRIYIMGFSQGACLVLETTARIGKPMGGIAAFTGGLIGSDLKSNLYVGDFKNTPVFIGNSDRDAHVPEERSAQSARQMQKLGANVNYKVYPGMPHTIISEELDLVRQLFFKKDAEKEMQ